ncbi:hypothetical protein EON66_11375, partial [archaeon]
MTVPSGQRSRLAEVFDDSFEEGIVDAGGGIDLDGEHVDVPLDVGDTVSEALLALVAVADADAVREALVV